MGEFLSQACVEERNPFEVNAARGDPPLFQRRRFEWVRRLGIRSLLARKLAHLSNGELRRTLLVHALLKSPRVLILEDPYAGLDAATRRALHRVIDQLMRGGQATLVATSRPEDIPSAVSHLLWIDRHRIVAHGPQRAILREWRARLGRGKRSERVGLPRGVRVGARGGGLAGEPLVELRAVTVRSGRQRILHDVTWTVRAGEGWVVEGANGAGKTTLLNLIQGDHPQAYAQDIRWFGRAMDSTRALWEIRQQLGWMSPELHQHYPGEWAITDVVRSGFFNTIGLYERCTRAQGREARRWPGDLGLAAQAHEPFGSLSFRQQRLVLLARAAVKRPRLLVLDEPCQGLDADQRQTLLELVDSVATRSQSGLIFVTHRAVEIPRCITHRLRLVAGRVRTAGPFRRR